MIDFLGLIKNTSAYKTMLGDKKLNRLSHAYLVICPDKKFLTEYIKEFAKVIMGDSHRDKQLINSFTHPDVVVFPEKDSVVVEDVNKLIEESYLKPIEKDKKLFLVLKAETMNAPSQNKLLKTLEEPPKNVHIILGATSEYPLLSTVKSRVKKLELPPIDYKTLYSALSSEFGESEKLKSAVACANGMLGKAIEQFEDQNFQKRLDLVCDILVNMQSSKNVLEYSGKIADSKLDFGDILDTLKLTLRDMLMHFCGSDNLINNPEYFDRVKGAKGFNKGAVVYILDKITDAEKRKFFNNNATMLIEWLLFSILEGKHKWQQLSV